MGRVYTIAEVGGKMYVATPMPVSPEIADWLIVLARRDGTEPVVVAEREGKVHCTCRAGQAGDYCRHVQLLRKQALILERTKGTLAKGVAALAGWFNQTGPAGRFRLALPEKVE